MLSTVRTPSPPAPSGRSIQDYAGLVVSPAAGRDVVFARGQEIYAEGDPACAFYHVKSGVLRAYKLSPDGKRQIIAFHFPGDLIGFETGLTHKATVEAVSPATTLRIERSRLETSAGQDPSLSRALLAHIIESMGRSADHLFLLGRKSAIERVASFLVDMADRLGTTRFELAMSRYDIADFLGLSVETVSRTFTWLCDRKVIALDGSRHVAIVSQQVLQAIAEEMSGVHLPKEPASARLRRAS